MVDFFSDLSQFAFLRYALITGLLASVACGVVGSFVTVRRIGSLAGAIAHSTLGGLGAAMYLNRNHGIPITPLQGAMAAALLAALIIGLMSIYGKQREDTVLNAVWAIGMALGIFFISRTRGYASDLMSYLFGNILMVRRVDMALIGVLDTVIVGTSLLFYNTLQALTFDEEFTRLRGVPTAFFYLLLLVLTALTIVLLVQIVGIVLVIALLTLPAATANLFSVRLWQMMLWAVVLCMLYTSAGLYLSYGPNLPAGPTIILCAGAAYLLVTATAALRRKG
jgi:zinc transport system permease protein